MIPPSVDRTDIKAGSPGGDTGFPKKMKMYNMTSYNIESIDSFVWIPVVKSSLVMANPTNKIHLSNSNSPRRCNLAPYGSRSSGALLSYKGYSEQITFKSGAKK